MLDKSLAEYIAGQLRVRRQAFENDKRPDVLEKLDKAINVMDALGRGDAIASLWWIDDVYSLTEDWEGNTTVKITQAEARAVLANAEHNHNAEIGINWDVLREHLDMVLEQRNEDPSGGDGNDD